MKWTKTEFEAAAYPDGQYRTLEEIGRDLGLTRERVRQVLRKYGIQKRRERERQWGACADCGKRIQKQNRRCWACFRPAMPPVTLTCDHCGKEFDRARRDLNRQQADSRYKGCTYCSRTCGNAATARQLPNAVRHRQLVEWRPIMALLRAQGHSLAAIAEAMDINRNTVSRHLTEYTRGERNGSD